MVFSNTKSFLLLGITIIMIFPCMHLSRSPSVINWSSNARGGAQVLLCNGRFYQGYRMKEGDSGEIVFQNSPLNNLCLWKFFPSSCVLSFSCSQFSVSSGSDQATCSSKLITKVEGESARRWCGKVEPPQKENQMGIREPFLVGYFALNAGIELKGDQFKCNIGCHRLNQLVPKPTTARVEVEDLKCKCGVTLSSRVRRGSSLSRAFLPAMLSPSYLNQSPYLLLLCQAQLPGRQAWP